MFADDAFDRASDSNQSTTSSMMSQERLSSSSFLSYQVVERDIHERDHEIFESSMKNATNFKDDDLLDSNFSVGLNHDDVSYNSLPPPPSYDTLKTVERQTDINDFDSSERGNEKHFHSVIGRNLFLELNSSRPKTIETLKPLRNKNCDEVPSVNQNQSKSSRCCKETEEL